MSEKGFGSKIFGLFVETEGESPESPPQPKSAADAVAELAAQSRPASNSPAPSAAPLAPGAKVDFEAIFREAGMDVTELDRVGKAEQLLRTLPPEAPEAVKKQIVEASLKAFGFEIQRIVAAAQNQQKAIDAYVKVNESATAHALKETEAQVKALTEKVAQLRADAERRSANLTVLSAAARARKDELGRILTFFHSGSTTDTGAGGPSATSDKT